MKLLFNDIIKSMPTEYSFDLGMDPACLENTIVVLDDDPTGCQTVHNVPVLFSWEPDILYELLLAETHLFFILTNTRSLSETEAVNRLGKVLYNLDKASQKSGRAYTLVSRSDSTLRGHYPAELDTISSYLHHEKAMHCLIPAFFQGGRYTINDVHYAKESEFLVPVSETPFSKDTVFGYAHADLKLYIEEKTQGRIKAKDVLSFSLDELREGGPEFVKRKLLNSEAPACIVNALSQKDLDVFSAGVWEAILSGKKILFRTAASFINSLGCIPVKEILNTQNLNSESSRGGLIVVGSHVPKTTRQLDRLVQDGGINPLELDVQLLLRDKGIDQVVAIASRAAQLIRNGRHVVLYTSRKLYQPKEKDELIDIGKIISETLVQIVKSIDAEPSFFIAKGGITSHDIAEKGLGIRKAMVLGQALPGIPVLSDEERPDMKYIIFPGNVGDDEDLLILVKKLMQ